MLPQASAWAAARDFWIFGGFPRFLTRSRKGPEQLAAGRIRRAAGHDPAGRIQRAGDQKAGLFSGYRGPVNFPDFYRQPDHGPRITGRYVWGGDRGTGSGKFNCDLRRYKRPAAGIKKPAGRLPPAGALWACVGFTRYPALTWNRPALL